MLTIFRSFASNLILIMIISLYGMNGWAQNYQGQQSQANLFHRKVTGIFSELRKVKHPSEYRTHIGLDFGVQSPRGDTGSTPGLGINMGFQPYIPFGAGLEISTSRFDDDKRHQQTLLLVRGSYNFSGDIPILKYSYIGLGLGPMFVSDKVEWSIAPLLGFDLPLKNINLNDFSLGLNMKYVMSTDSPQSLVTNASLKYWY